MACFWYFSNNQSCRTQWTTRSRLAISIFQSKSNILSPNKQRVVQPVTCRDRPITAVIQLLFLLEGTCTVPDLGQNKFIRRQEPCFMTDKLLNMDKHSCRRSTTWQLKYYLSGGCMTPHPSCKNPTGFHWSTA